MSNGWDGMVRVGSRLSMVQLLDGYSEIGAQVMCNLFNLIC